MTRPTIFQTRLSWRTLLLCTLLAGRTLSAQPVVVDRAAAMAEAETLYKQRANLQSASRAADIWQTTADSDFESAWKLSRICYFLGTHLPLAQRRSALDRGTAAAEAAIRRAPNRPEGHFWLAASIGEIAQTGGVSQGLKYRTRIRKELEQVIAIDPRWEQGSAEAGLGRWYAKVPGLLGGDQKKAEQHLRQALAINPNYRNAMFDLAELLIKRGEVDPARALLQRIIDLPPDEDWAPEDRDLAARATEKLASLEK